MVLKNNGTSQGEVRQLNVSELEIHPSLTGLYEGKKKNSVRALMHEFGQLQDISVLIFGDKKYVTHGCIRTFVAKEDPEKFPTLNCKIRYDFCTDFRLNYILENTQEDKSVSQVCAKLDEVLRFIKKQQGKKRDFSKYFPGEPQKNRLDAYDYASLFLGGEFSGATLRKLERVYKFETQLPKEQRLGLLDKIDTKELSIDAADKLLKRKEERDQQREISKLAKIVSMSFVNSDDRPYKLYNQSSIDLSVLEDNSIDMMFDSHPYPLSQRKYRNQDSMKHGQERTIGEYFDNFGNINLEKFKKLKIGGVLGTIIGESYRNGYQSVCSLAELKLREIGFKIIDVITWEKTNQQYAQHPFRFQNVKEQIIIAVKPGADPSFNLPLVKELSGNDKLKKNVLGNFYLENGDKFVKNVIRTPVFNPKELSVIDPNFKHDAPAPMSIYELFIGAYSNPGDTICDCFVGAGTVGVGLKMGRKVIGFDVDHESIVFCQKRFEYYLNQIKDEVNSVAA